MIYKKVLLSLVVGLVFILGWSPWLSKDEVKEVVKANKNFQYQHAAEKDTADPEIRIAWLPFCRWTTTYEGGWFVCFWHGFKKGSSLVMRNNTPVLDELTDEKIYIDNEYREKELIPKMSVSPTVFHPISEEAACDLALRFNSFDQKIDIALIRKSYSCITNSTDPNIPVKLPGFWSAYLLPTSSHSQYQVYVAAKSTYEVNFVPAYAISKETSVIFPLSHRAYKRYVQSDNSFRLITEDEYNKLFELMDSF